MKKVLLLLLMAISVNVFSQRNNQLYRFVNTPYYFSLDCPRGLIIADNCTVMYHHTEPTTGFSTRTIEVGKGLYELDNNGVKIGKFIFSDDFTGYHLRYRDKKKRMFRNVIEEDFNELYSDNKVVGDLIGRRTNKWKFEDLEEIKSVTRISNDGLTRQLGLKLQDRNTGKFYYMVVQVSYELSIDFFVKDVKQISYSAL